MSEITPRIETRPAWTALVQPHTVPMSEVANVMGRALPAAYAACQQQGFQMTGPPLTRYPEMGGDPCTLEPGIPVVGPIEAPDGFEVIESPEGTVAVFVHAGGYDTLGKTWMAAFGWVKANARELSGAPWEVYVTDPGELPNPADWRTEICLPLK